jgi:hypothetical protein
MEIRVECYNGFRGQESPRRLVMGQRKIEVVEIIDRWLAPDHRYFKLRGDDNCLYIIRYDVPGDRWELVFLNALPAATE